MAVGKPLVIAGRLECCDRARALNIKRIPSSSLTLGVPDGQNFGPLDDRDLRVNGTTIASRRGMETPRIFRIKIRPSRNTNPQFFLVPKQGERQRAEQAEWQADREQQLRSQIQGRVEQAKWVAIANTSGPSRNASGPSHSPLAC